MDTATKPSLADAQALIQKRDFAGAEELLAEMMARKRWPALVPALLAFARFRLGKREEALAAVTKARALKPPSAEPRRQLGWVLSNEGLTVEAVSALRQACEEFPDDAALHAQLSEAALIAGDGDASIVAIECAHGLDADNASYGVQQLAILAVLGRHEEASALRQSRKDDGSLLFEMCRKLVEHLARKKRHAGSLALANWVADIFPDESEPRLWQGEALLALDRPGEASTVLGSAAQPGDDALRLRQARLGGRVAQALNNPEGEIAAWTAVLALAPHDSDALTRLIFASRALGRAADARRYAEDYDRAQGKGLPTNLAAGLVALASLRTPPAVMNEKIRWGWELADKSRWTFERWWERVVWGRRAAGMLMAWWRGAPDRVAELDALIDGADPAVFAGLQDTGCIITGTHLGPIAGGVRYLDTRSHAFKSFGGGAMYARDNHILVSANPLETFRALKDALDNGVWVGVANDGKSRGRDQRATFAGREIGVATLIPRAVLVTGVPSLWFQPIWREGRIAIEAERLPDPQEGESEEDWCRRWTAAYLAKVERLVRGAPENLMFASGIWLHALVGSVAEEAAAAQADDT